MALSDWHCARESNLDGDRSFTNHSVKSCDVRWHIDLERYEKDISPMMKNFQREFHSFKTILHWAINEYFKNSLENVFRSITPCMVMAMAHAYVFKWTQCIAQYDMWSIEYRLYYLEYDLILLSENWLNFCFYWNIFDKFIKNFQPRNF